MPVVLDFLRGEQQDLHLEALLAVLAARDDVDGLRGAGIVNLAVHLLDPRVDGCFCEKLPRPKDAPEGQRMGSVEHMHVVYADPQAGLLRMTGALGPLQVEPVRGTMTFTLKPAGEGTRIELTYLVGGFMKMKGGDMAPLVDKVLSEQLGRLVQRLAPAPAEAAPEKKD